MGNNKKRRGSGQKIRVNFRKKYDDPARRKSIGMPDERPGAQGDESHAVERVTGKGRLTRKRTIVTNAAGDDDSNTLLVDQDCIPGRVLSVHGAWTTVQSQDGSIYNCALRGLLKTLATNLRHVVVAGDRVMIRVESQQQGLIVRVENRYGELSRMSRGKRHLLVANVDHMIIVTSAAEPLLKPNLVDRFLITAEKAGIRPLICVNKIDLVPSADLQPLIGVWSQLGYRVLLTSTVTGQGIDRLREAASVGASVVVGQSGVGKSSLANAIEPGLDLRTAHVSRESQKGRHTTTTARLLPLSHQAYLVDTPGIRQFQLWDVIAEEVAGYFRDIRPLVSMCRFPDCTHLHEDHCAVKDAVADGRLDPRRYESFCGMYEENRVRPGPKPRRLD